MDIKLVAVDMDGTFLSQGDNYNRERFARIYQQFTQQNIRFVVASGNQMFQLQSFFPEIVNDISFVAENGAYILHQNEELFAAKMEADLITSVLEILADFPEIDVLICGKKSAYALDSTRQEFLDYASAYYHKIQKVSAYSEIQDQIFKIALKCPEADIMDILAKLKHKLGKTLVPTYTGWGYIDLIIPGVHKANGLAVLGNHLDINKDEMIAFGDSGNDLEMLEFVKYGFAMANADANIKDITNLRAPYCKEEGVLTILEEYLANPEAFVLKYGNK